MKTIYDLNEIRKNNSGNLPPCPKMPINGYSRGFAMMLSDGIHEGICFPGFETKDEAIKDAENSPAIPADWHLYILHANGIDFINPSHVRWGVWCECVKEA